MKRKAYLLGVDVGTSSAKALIMDEDGRTIASAACGYEIITPEPGFAEQDADMLKNAAFQAIRQAVLQIESAQQIAAVGVTGQMHGLVALGKDDRPLRRVIIWADQRAKEESDFLRRSGAEEKTLNPASTGFLLPSLLWVKRHEPDVFANIRSVMMPKDYIRFCMTGEKGTDLSDASGTLLYNPKLGRWDPELLAATDISAAILPQIHASAQVAGSVTARAAQLTGLSAGTPVVYGGGDTPMLLTGNGVVSEGDLATNIGTASQINCICSNAPAAWKQLNVFHHASEQLWFAAGASLNGGIVLKWAKDTLLGGSVSFSEMDELAAQSAPGAKGVVLLPFLCGERAPYLNPTARAVLFGMELSTTRADIVRSVMESVVYSFRDCMEVFASLGLKMSDSVVASGGGSRSPVWLQMQADILKKRILVRKEGAEAARGAAIAAGVGIGLYTGYPEAARRTAQKTTGVYEPDSRNFAVYDERFETYRSLYTSNKALF